MKFQVVPRRKVLFPAATGSFIMLLLATGCSGQHYFSVLPVQKIDPHVFTETFSPLSQVTSNQNVSPKVRILFVEDNSGSMDKYQATILQGFTNFANTYFRKDLDLATAVITTDTYLAGETSNADYGPFNGSCYARLVPGVHDGARPAVADGISNAFDSNCQLSSDALTQILSNGDRSLMPIVSSLPPDGSAPSADYTAGVISEFNMNIKAGTSGSGSERGFESLYRFLVHNEGQPSCSGANPDKSCFFPHYDYKNSQVLPVYAIVVLSDEHDQSDSSFGLPGVPAFDHRASVIQLYNDSQMLSSAAQDAQYAKAMLDSFFLGLQSNSGTDPRYSFFGIVNISCSGSLDTSCGIQPATGKRDPNERWGPEYSSLVDQLKADGNNSLAANSAAYDINSSDYNGLFNFIGNEIVSSTKVVAVSSFTLAHPVADVSQLSASWKLPDGTLIPVPRDWLSLGGPTTLNIQSQFQNLLPAGTTDAVIVVSYPSTG